MIYLYWSFAIEDRDRIRIKHIQLFVIYYFNTGQKLHDCLSISICVFLYYNYNYISYNLSNIATEAEINWAVYIICCDRYQLFRDNIFYLTMGKQENFTAENKEKLIPKLQLKPESYW